MQVLRQFDLQVTDVGNIIRRCCDEIYYIPVNKRYLHTIVFSFDNLSGKQIDISYKTSLVLHFRKRRNRNSLIFGNV